MRLVICSCYFQEKGAKKSIAMSMHDGGRQLRQQQHWRCGGNGSLFVFSPRRRQLLLIVRSRGIITTNGWSIGDESGAHTLNKRDYYESKGHFSRSLLRRWDILFACTYTTTSRDEIRVYIQLKTKSTMHRHIDSVSNINLVN